MKSELTEHHLALLLHRRQDGSYGPVLICCTMRIMRFTLTYSGRLPSSSNAGVKHRIRLDLHPQLKELWNTHPALAEKQDWITPPNVPVLREEERGVLLKEVGGNYFATLVNPYLRLYTELDILVLRPENPGALITHSGDIDNQLKTLFDALRRPVDTSEVPKAWSSLADESPLHCLLDDDKLITRVSVETDRLLHPGADPKDVQVTIRVAVKGFTAAWGNLGLIG
ncbi:hypothetical protein ACQPZF_05715 [Actinosynnema sp. CS-041913]|uniref:hypothetical protein n=1 Tax=Actinosynnema sp. CS-041913 TaxID=3239917 RepID=UPI003D936A9B